MNVAGSTAADLMSILTNKKEKKTGEENPFAALFAQALEAARSSQSSTATQTVQSAATESVAGHGGASAVSFPSYPADAVLPGAASAPAASGSLLTTSPAWKEDLFRKIDADPDYLPESVAEAGKNAAYYGDVLNQRYADDLRRYGVTHVPLDNAYPKKVSMAGGFHPAFVDGKYIMTAGWQTFGSARKLQPPQGDPGAFTKYMEEFMEAHKGPEPTEEDHNALHAKMNAVGASAEYGDMPEKYAINLIISKLASKNAAFKNAYDANPRKAVEEYLEELGPIMKNPHLVVTKIEK